ncbi:rRNA methyltransferase [Sphingomonas ginsenosidivorax]|uniref:rRNA methyltransferase n=1 Tax=Sphingomonas ginsenosidivorax TaxID=862135 RepID=A0A5C6UI90_9SPHN|nr:TrmH family RNA methyltransferase [Sphingomonas ginsenosidivorax]TXC71936.1 rRNA methyltransferase [Sphingomonas ginsenosidivorax]
MTFWAYIVRCADDSYYTGHTDDLERRIGQHNLGEVAGYTQKRRPVTLMWSQEFPSRQEALAAEFQVKDWSRKKKEALFRADWAALSEAARKQPPAPRYDASTSSASTRDERGETQTPPPIIILVRPQLGENIGKAARAMLNFGLVEMRLVSPRDGWPNPTAGPAASGADIVLQNAQVYDTVADAVADCEHVYATTVRKRGVTKPVVTPEVAGTAIHTGPGRSAILFGPERSGLETDDVAVARTIITVPINPEFGSLNLAQAVILVAYEWSKGVALAQPPEVDMPVPSSQEELDGMIAQLDGMLVGAGYFFPEDRGPALRRTLRTLLTKPAWSGMEIRTLRGVLSALAGKRPRPAPIRHPNESQDPE